MPKDADSFAALLTEGIYAIKRREGKLISVIQDEIGYALEKEGGAMLEYWRKGNLPISINDVRTLGRIIIQRGGLSREWYAHLLDRYGYFDDDIITLDMEQVLSGPVSSSFPEGADSNLPVKAYHEFIGRKVLIDEIVELLKNTAHPKIVAITGMGGIGKTSLAREAASICIEQSLFNSVVWIQSFKKETFDMSYISGIGLTFESVLDTIIVQIGRNEIAGLSIEQKQEQVRKLLSERQVLIILDNMETSNEPQDEIMHRLHPLLASSHVLATSRQRFREDVYPINLGGLHEPEAIEFIQKEAREKQIRIVAQASNQDLNEICRATGGSPLAIKVVAGQLHHLPMEVVLQQLKKIIIKSSNEYSRFYRYIFLPSWELLSFDGQKLLVSMANFTPGIGGAFEAIQRTSQLSIDILGEEIDHLWRLSFLELADQSTIRHTRYYLHPLTNNFVMSDIIQQLPS